MKIYETFIARRQCNCLALCILITAELDLFYILSLSRYLNLNTLIRSQLDLMLLILIIL